MAKRHKVAPSGSAVFPEPPAADTRTRYLIGLVTLNDGQKGYLRGRFPVVPNLKAETDERYTGGTKT